MWHKIPFNLIPFFSKSEKKLSIEEIFKKTSVPPLFTDIFYFTTIFGGSVLLAIGVAETFSFEMSNRVPKLQNETR